MNVQNHNFGPWPIRMRMALPRLKRPCVTSRLGVEAGKIYLVNRQYLGVSCIYRVPQVGVMASDLVWLNITIQ